jgi:DNA-binding transcriptional LysR family regulator
MTCVGWPSCREESCAASAWKRVQRCKEVQIVAITCKIVSCPASGLTSRQSAGNLVGRRPSVGPFPDLRCRQFVALEDVLGTTLVERTTRHLSLTESGRLYYERAKQILEEVAEAERGLKTQTGVASGRLHVSAPTLLGRLLSAPMLPGFLAEQIRVSIDLMLVDRPLRLAEEGIDVALRIGPLEDSGLIVRKLDDIQLVVCTAPDFLRRRGKPATPDDLVEQDCLAFGDVPGVAEWSFQDGAMRRSLRIPTRPCANDFDTLVSSALAGAGLVRVPFWQVEHYLADGRLRIVLDADQPPPMPLSILTLRNRDGRTVTAGLGQLGRQRHDLLRHA